MRRMKCAVTGAAGQLAYDVLFKIAEGLLFGPNVVVDIALIDLPEMQNSLEGVRYELQDCAYPTLGNVDLGLNKEDLFQGADAVFLIGAKPRGPGMERKDLLQANGHIFQEQGRILDRAVSPSCKILVVGNPCNTNCLILLKNAPNLDPHNFSAMTMLDEFRARAALKEKAGVLLSDVQNIYVWGNHSSTLVPDYSSCTISGKKAEDVLGHDWLRNEFISLVQKRGAMVIQKRGKSSAASAARAAIVSMKSMFGIVEDRSIVSSARWTRFMNELFPSDLVVSMPHALTSKGLEPALQFRPSAEIKELIDRSIKELQEERDEIRALL